MKSILVLLFAMFSFSAFAQEKEKKNKNKDTQVVEASCGTCKFGMKGDDCELAVRIDGKAYLVDGSGINEHGDAHAKDGFCNAIRKAKVKGKIVDDKFVATYFKLVPNKAKKG